MIFDPATVTIDNASDAGSWAKALRGRAVAEPRNDGMGPLARALKQLQREKTEQLRREMGL